MIESICDLENNVPFNILLIENDRNVVSQIKKWLKPYANIVHVSGESQILDFLQNYKWDLVVTDIKLPNLNDVDITKIAKSIDPFVAVLIITQGQKINFILEALKNHADALEFKPLKKKQLVDVALKLISTSQASRKKERKVILAIGAHPDDVEIGCGGALARHVMEGDIVHILTLSMGAAGGNPAIRKKEAETAARIQKATLHLENLNDTAISAGTVTIKIIEKIVRNINPTHVYTHSMHDTHSDHRNVHHATISGCRNILNLYCYQSSSSTVEFEPNLFIEITETALKQKLKAIATYKSQCRLRPYLAPDLIRATARYWGRYCDYNLAEPLEVVKQKIMTLQQIPLILSESYLEENESSFL